jgi:phospholipid/cholesterol/gamma-HCH transport system substrate-binding protein
VELAPNAIFGGAVAQIVGGGESPELAPPGAVLPGSSATALPEKVGEVANESQKTLERLQALLSDRTVEGVEGSVEQLRELLTELSQTVSAQRAEVDRIVRNLNGAARHAEKLAASPELERSVQRLDTITTNLDGAAASIDRASRSLDVVMGRLERGEGTLGHLMKDDTLYQNANQAVANLNRTTVEVRALAMDLRQNPKRYVHLSLF